MASKHWGEYVEEISAEESFLPRSDFMMSSYDSMPDEAPMTDETKMETKQDVDQKPRICSTFKDSLLAYTAQLLKYKTELTNLLKTAANVNNHIDLPEAPPLPVPDVTVQQKLNDTHIYSAPDLESDFARGLGTAPIVIDRKSCKLLLRQSVAQLCLHQGFELSTSAALDGLTSAAQNFLEKFTVQLRKNVDNEALNGPTGYQDVIHQTLSHIRYGDIPTLISNHRENTIGRARELSSECSEMLDKYNNIRQTGVIPEDVAALLSDSEEEEEEGEEAGVADNEDDDTQKLLELAGMSGFDIKIENEGAEEPEIVTQKPPMSVEEPEVKKTKKSSKPAPSKRRKR